MLVLTVAFTGGPVSAAGARAERLMILALAPGDSPTQGHAAVIAQGVATMPRVAVA